MKLQSFILKSFTIPILLVMLFIAGCAGATSGSSPSSGANEVFAKIVTLQFLVDLGVLPGAIDPMEGFTRFMLLILLFALLFRLLDHLLGRGTAIAVSLVVSLMTVIFIPGTILLMIATSYGTLFSVILLLVPIGLGIAAHWFLKEHPFIRAVLMGAIAFLLYALMKYIESWTTGASTEYDTVINAVSGWINIVFWAVIVLAVWNFFAGIHSGATGHSGEYSSSPKRLVDIGKKIGDLGGRFGKWGFNKVKNRGANAAKKALVLHVEQENELEKLRAVEDSIEKFKEFHKEVMDFKGFEKASNKTDIIDSLEAINKSIEEAKKEIKPLTKITRKEENAFNKLFKILKEKGYDLAKIEGKERDILVQHKKCTDALENMENVFKSREFKDATASHNFRLDASEFPYFFVDASGRKGGAPNGFKYVKGTPPQVIIDKFKEALETYDVLVETIKHELKTAIEAEEEAKKMLEGVIAETKELLA